MENKPKYTDELNYKELLKQPYRLFGLYYIYILTVILIGGIFYVKHLDYISFNKLSPRLAADTLEIPVVQKKKGGIQLAADFKFIQNPTPELIAKGEELFKSSCASCHGDNGDGNGPAGMNLNPKPRDFHAKDGWTNGRKFSDIFKTLTEGILKNGMASYEYIPANDRFALIHYIRTFANDFPDITDDEVKNLEITYHLLEGQKQPNTIPVELAENIIAKENAPVLENANLLLRNLASEPDKYNFLRSLTNDPQRAVASVLRNNLYSDFSRFKEILTREQLQLGFNVKVLRLSDYDWKKLFDIFNKS